MERLHANVDHISFKIEQILDEQLGERTLPFDGMDKSTAGICNRFLKNECQLGDKCAYRHIRRDKTVVCKHWVRGLCKKGEKCEFLHEFDPDKMPECYFFNTYGECGKKDCPFIHKDAQQVRNCPWYDRGFCRHGAACKNRHARVMLCLNYAAGFCQKGPECELFHPTFELPVNDPVTQSLIKCHNCGEMGHKATVCPALKKEEAIPNRHAQMAFNNPAQNQGQSKQFRPLDQVTCFKCGQKGHYANKCPATALGFNFRKPPTNM